MRNRLPVAVQCRSIYAFFETIAAFDCESAALAYAFQCAKANPSYTYRVMNGKKEIASNHFGIWGAA